MPISNNKCKKSDEKSLKMRNEEIEKFSRNFPHNLIFGYIIVQGFF